MEKFEGLIGIEEFLTKENFGFPIKIDELDLLVEEICANTSLIKNQAERAVLTFFREIRYQMLQGNKINLGKFGYFEIHSPATKWKPTKVIKMQFKPNKAFKRILNDQ